ncbi:MAG TPA: glutaredoxin family protein [Gaiellaceae bacterium]|nr:glutaredoxin family protein [Gaiellaceae bacterium]
MGDGPEPEPADARRRLRARCAAGRRGDRHARDLPVDRVEVTLYTAAGCHLCEAARRVVSAARDELGFDVREVAIDGDPRLEAEYRAWIPVVEIDGRRRFVHHVHPDALRRAVVGAAS